MRSEDYFLAPRLKLTIITPEKTVIAAKTFCHVSVSMPMEILMTMAMMGCTYEYILTSVGRMSFWLTGIKK